MKCCVQAYRPRTFWQEYGRFYFTIRSLAHLCYRSTAIVCFLIVGLQLVAATPVKYNHNFFFYPSCFFFYFIGCWSWFFFPFHLFLPHICINQIFIETMWMINVYRLLEYGCYFCSSIWFFSSSIVFYSILFFSPFVSSTLNTVSHFATQEPFIPPPLFPIFHFPLIPFTHFPLFPFFLTLVYTFFVPLIYFIYFLTIALCFTLTCLSDQGQILL